MTPRPAALRPAARAARTAGLLAALALGLTSCGPAAPDPAAPSPAVTAAESTAESTAGPAGTAGTAGTSDTPGNSETSLQVEFSPDGTAAMEVYTLECDGGVPAAGSAAPDPAAACAALAAGGEALFAEPRGLSCTQQITGPQRARVTGTVNGTAVDSSFSLTDGCQISRWLPLTGLLGPAEGLL